MCVCSIDSVTLAEEESFYMRKRCAIITICLNNRKCFVFRVIDSFAHFFTIIDETIVKMHVLKNQLSCSLNKSLKFLDLHLKLINYYCVATIYEKNCE